MDEADIRTILTELLRVFPVQEINICMPHWITELEKHHWLRESVFSCIRQAAGEVHTIRDTDTFAETICTCPYITGAAIREIHMGTGSVIVDVRWTLHSSIGFWAKKRDWKSTAKAICCPS